MFNQIISMCRYLSYDVSSPRKVSERYYQEERYTLPVEHEQDIGQVKVIQLYWQYDLLILHLPPLFLPLLPGCTAP